MAGLCPDRVGARADGAGGSRGRSGAGTGRTDPGRHVGPVDPRHLLRRDPPHRGLQCVPGRRHRRRDADDAGGLRRRAAREDAVDVDPGLDARQLGDRRRQPDRDGARCAARRPARSHRGRHPAGRGLPARRHDERAWQRHRRSDDAVPRQREPVDAERSDLDRDALQQRIDRDRQPGGLAAQCRLRQGSGVRVRPGDVDRLHAARQPGVGGAGARRFCADPPRRQVLRRENRRRPAGLGRPQQGLDSAGRRAAAPAREPDRRDERQPQAAAALLVLPERQEGRRHHDRRRPRQRRHRRPLRPVQGAQPGQLLGRELGVRARHVLRLSVDPADRCAGRAVHGRRFRGRSARDHRLRRLHRVVAAGHLRPAGAGVAGAVPERRPAAHAAPPLHRVERLEQRRRGAAVQGHATGHLVLLLAAELGCRRARDVHRIGDADALHEAGRQLRRRLHGGHADDRRVRPDLSEDDRHAARPRGRRRGLLRRLHRQRTHRHRAVRRRRCGRHVGARARRADRLGQADADLARRPQCVELRRDRVQRRHAELHSDEGCVGERPAGHAAAALRQRAAARADA